MNRIKLCELGTEQAIKALADCAVLWCRCKSGVWSEYGKPIPTDKAIEQIRKSPYGADVWLVYNGEQTDENLLYAEVSMPCRSDMW